METVARLSLKSRILERLLCMVGSGAPVERVWSDVLDAAMEAVPSEASSFFLADAKGGLTIVAARGRVSDKILGLKLKAGAGVAGACLRDRRTIAVSDVSRDPRHAAQLAQALGFETRSLLAAPVTHDGAALGVLEVVNKSGADEFPRHEVELLERIAGTAGDLLALRRAPAKKGKKRA
jgi:GAF domain-containing protein